MPLLYSLLSTDPNKQSIYYQTGIGTYHPIWTPSGILGTLTQLADSAVAWDLGQHIKDGYTFLMETYKPDDRIFLFGFSRGAFTARCLAGMIQQVGILLPGNSQSVPLAYQIYKAADQWLVPPKCGDASCRTCGDLLADAFKRTFAREAHIHFVGVWDTVASVGAVIPRTLPFASGGHSITTFRQALSLDERRARFPPQQFQSYNPTISPSPCPFSPSPSSSLLPSSSLPSYPSTNALEVFFPGSHSDVGGGSSPTDNDVLPRLSHLSLRWMLHEASLHSLELDPHAVIHSPLYAPFVTDAAFHQLPSFHSPQEDNPSKPGKKKRPARPNPRNSSKAFMDLLLSLGAAPSSATAILDARANRSDALSYSIGVPKDDGWTGWMGRVVKRAVTTAWWILEVVPGMRIEWDVRGQAKKWAFGSHLGHGRLVPTPATFHPSIRTRMSTTSSSFAPPNGTGLVERDGKYVPNAVFGTGKGIDDVQWME
ncbi:hypothetical protein RQP46_010183 [Phenoliferia psychrophenolica]